MFKFWKENEQNDPFFLKIWKPHKNDTNRKKSKKNSQQRLAII